MQQPPFNDGMFVERMKGNITTQKGVVNSTAWRSWFQQIYQYLTTLGMRRWKGTDIDGTAQVVIANGNDDVTAVLNVQYAVSESAGGVDGGNATVSNGASIDLYDDGVDVCTLTVAADGSVTIARSAGASSFDVSLCMVWL